MKWLIKILSLVGVLLSNISAQSVDRPSVGAGKLNFYLDHSSFLGNENKSYTEFYMMIYADQLKLVEKDDVEKATIQLKTKLTDENQNTVSEKSWTTEASFRNINDVRTLVVNDKWGEFINPGNYTLSVNIKDAEGRSEGKVETQVEVPQISSDKISLSQIRFINGIDEKSGSENILSNASRRYGLLNPTLIFYYELYSAEKYLNSIFNISYNITDANNKLVKRLTLDSVKAESKTKALMQAIDISKLQTGIYTFEIIVKDVNNSVAASTKRNFEIIQQDYFSTVPFLTEQDSKIFEKLLGYIATPQQMNFYKSLNGVGRASYLVRFFKDIDPTPETNENEYLQALIQRYQYCNKNFSWYKTEGWTTERGRVFIQFGKPDEVEYHNLDMGARPYEIWYYQGNREIYYVFADLLGNGQYTLLHSNKEGEITNSKWRELVIKF